MSSLTDQAAKERHNISSLLSRAEIYKQIDLKNLIIARFIYTAEDLTVTSSYVYAEEPSTSVMQELKIGSEILFRPSTTDNRLLQCHHIIDIIDLVDG